MSGRALCILVNNMRPKTLTAGPLMVSTVPRMVWHQPTSFSLPIRKPLSTSSWLRNGLSDEDEVILLVGTTNNQSRMRYDAQCRYFAV